MKNIKKKLGESLDLSEAEFRQLTTLLGKIITLCPSNAYEPYLAEARTVLGDPDDLPYAALAIALTISRPGLPEPDIVADALLADGDLAHARIHDIDECGIWTNDPHLHKREPEFFKRFGIRLWRTSTLYALLSA